LATRTSSTQKQENLSREYQHDVIPGPETGELREEKQSTIHPDHQINDQKQMPAIVLMHKYMHGGGG
jgi:hypothetical protein